MSGRSILDFAAAFAAWDLLLLGDGLTLLLTSRPSCWDDGRDRRGLGQDERAGLVARTGQWLCRGGAHTPFLLQLYSSFSDCRRSASALTPNEAALLAMVVNLGAYATEIVRAGIEAIPHGQVEAGKALGFRPLQIFRLIIMPAGDAADLSPAGRAVHDGPAGLERGSRRSRPTN